MRCRISSSQLSIRQALLLGALHGPAELLPVSSSAHTSAVPWLLGWSYSQLEDELRKVFEVALHTGAVAAWLVRPRALGRPTRSTITLLVLATAPPAAAGLVLERAIESRLGTPATIAGGLLAGGLAMAMAERAPASRGVLEARGSDGIWLGLAQASALLPGVSRSGATLAAARFRRFTPAAARQLSALVGVPVILGATALKLVGVIRRPPSPGERAWLATGAGASFISTALLAPRLDRAEGRLHLSAFAAYRTALALAILDRLRRQAA